MVFAIGTLQDELEDMRELYAVLGAYVESSEARLWEGWVATPLSLVLWYWSERGKYGRGIYGISYYLEPVQYAVAVALIIPGAASHNVVNHEFAYPPLLWVYFSPEGDRAYLHLYPFIEVTVGLPWYVAQALIVIEGKVDWYIVRRGLKLNLTSVVV
jgi:hypothetical protein